jgi:purine-binding chemotaxis protein CheW
MDSKRAKPRRAASELGDRGADVEAARLAAIFARRAEELARLPDIDVAQDAQEALVFSLGDERYAFPTGQVAEVRPLGRLTPLPGAPAFVAGLINVRGRIVPVLDLRPLFGLPGPVDAAQAVVLMSSPRGTIGLLATDRPEVRWLAHLGLSGLPAGTPSKLDPTYVRGITSDLVVLLDAERLLADPRLVVQDETR